MPRGYRLFVLATFGWLILAGATENHHGAEETKQSEANGGVAKPAPTSIPTPQAKADQAPSKDCEGTDQPKLPCDAIAAQAAIDQARDAHRQILIGWLQACGLVASLVFSALATKAAFGAVKEAERGAQASKDSLDETRRMNAATVRPHVAIENAIIEFEEGVRSPSVILITRNAGSFTAHDWEWQPLLTYRVRGAEEDRKSRLFPWGPRGYRGVDLAPGGGEEQQIRTHINWPMDDAEYGAVCASPEDGLMVYLRIFWRSFDIFGNQVEDSANFYATIYGVGGVGGGQFTMQRVPAGTYIEGQEDKIPHAPNS